MYVIYDENGQPMRMVKTKHEANHIIKIYTDWSWRYIPTKNEKPFFEDAPF